MWDVQTANITQLGTTGGLHPTNHQRREQAAEPGLHKEHQTPKDTTLSDMPLSWVAPVKENGRQGQERDEHEEAAQHLQSEARAQTQWSTAAGSSS